MRPALLSTAGLVLLALLATAAVPAEGDRGTMVLAGTLFDGEKTTENRTLFLKDGRFVEDLEVGDVETVDAGGRWVVPGFVDASASLGLVGPSDERTVEVSPAFTAASEIDPRDPAGRRAVAAGVTALYVGPGTDNVVGGFGAVLRHDGEGYRIAARRAALEMNFTRDPARGNRPPRFRRTSSIYERRPTTRMGVVWILRRTFFRAAGEDEDPNVDVVRDALADGIPLRFTARREEDLRGVCRLAREFGLTGFTVADAHDAWRAADALSERGAKAVIPPTWYSGSGYGPDRVRVYLSGAAELAKGGVPFAIASDGDGARLREAAGLAFRFGLPRDAALAAITSRAAEIIGIEAGRIRPGRRADLVVLSGDPLEPATRVLRVIAAGRTVYQEDE